MRRFEGARRSRSHLKALIFGNGTRGVVTGEWLMKLWLYQHYVLGRLSWWFLAHDLTHDFAKTLTRTISSQLKRWAGLYSKADVGTLFRNRKNCGLGLTSVVGHFVRMQMIRCSLLKNSSDPSIRSTYAQVTARHAREKDRIWRPTRKLADADSRVDLSLRFPRVEGRQGLGAGVFNPAPSPRERRRLILDQVAAEEQEEHKVHAQTLAQQGVWLQWQDSTVPFDLSWRNLIFGPGPHLIKFVLNSTTNSVRTPDMLYRFKYIGSAECKLCDVKQCTLHHIISNCKPALKRYKWRHDSVLLNLVNSLNKFVASGMPVSPYRSLSRRSRAHSFPQEPSPNRIQDVLVC